MTKIFLIGMIIILLFNMVNLYMDTDLTTSLLNMTITAFLGLLVSTIPVVIVTLISPNSSGVGILFALGTLLNILFSITFTILTKTVSVGLGLHTRILNLFPPTFLYGFPYYIVLLGGLLMFIDGLITIIGGSGGE